VSEPNIQHYKKPWLWGWYYVGAGDGSVMTNLMSKRAAKRFLYGQYGSGGYGLEVLKHSKIPANRFLRRFGYLRNSG